MLRALVLLLLAAIAHAQTIWPKPTATSATAPGDAIKFSAVNFTFGDDSSDGLLAKATRRYEGIIRADGGGVAHDSAGAPYTVKLAVKDVTTPLSPGPDMDESYTLEAGAAGCSITAPTVWGAMKALETFSQLVTHGADGYTLLPTTIHDVPRFAWRGLMIDTGRMYLTPTVIKMALDGMSYTKLNILHWHMVDDQSFAIKSVVLPKLAGDGAFSPKHTYSLKDVSDIVAYARERGIAVLPELDMPGHSASWQRGYPDIRSKCKAHSGPNAASFTAPMDPSANATYELTDKLLKELDPLFPAAFPFWHLGGDEVPYSCWNNSDGGYIAAFMEKQGIAKGDFPGLQSYFEQRLISQVRDLPTKKRTVLWQDNSGDNTGALPKDAVVELWKEKGGDATVLDATIKAGWQVYYTTTSWYFDHGKTLTDGSWEFMYAVDPTSASTLPKATLAKAVLGAEACMWSPHFDSASFLVEAFPRTAAVAERLWSEQSVTDVDDARVRLHAWRCRLLQRGLATGPVAGGVPTGASGNAPPSGTTSFGGHCANGPWEPAYTPPF